MQSNAIYAPFQFNHVYTGFQEQNYDSDFLFIKDKITDKNDQNDFVSIDREMLFAYHCRTNFDLLYFCQAYVFTSQLKHLKESLGLNQNNAAYALSSIIKDPSELQRVRQGYYRLRQKFGKDSTCLDRVRKISPKLHGQFVSFFQQDQVSCTYISKHVHIC